jgi:hypothetical protein
MPDRRKAIGAALRAADVAIKSVSFLPGDQV